MTGALTTTLMAAIGVSVYSGGATTIGPVLLIFATLRGLMLIRQILRLRERQRADTELD